MRIASVRSELSLQDGKLIGRCEIRHTAHLVVSPVELQQHGKSTDGVGNDIAFFGEQTAATCVVSGRGGRNGDRRHSCRSPQ